MVLVICLESSQLKKTWCFSKIPCFLSFEGAYRILYLLLWFILILLDISCIHQSHVWELSKRFRTSTARKIVNLNVFSILKKIPDFQSGFFSVQRSCRFPYQDTFCGVSWFNIRSQILQKRFFGILYPIFFHVGNETVKIGPMKFESISTKIIITFTPFPQSFFLSNAMPSFSFQLLYLNFLKRLQVSIANALLF